MCDSGGGGNTASAEALYKAQAEISKEQFALWKQNFLPLEKQTISQVNELSNPAYVEQQVGQAKQDVGQQFTAARGTTERQLQGIGLNPADGMYTSGARQMNLAEAGAKAGAGNATRSGLRAQSLNAQGSMIGLGRNLAGSAQAGLGGAAGGLANIGAQQTAAANANNAATGQAVGTAAGLGMAAYGAGLLT